jgi:hypothetical protein
MTYGGTGARADEGIGPYIHAPTIRTPRRGGFQTRPNSRPPQGRLPPGGKLSAQRTDEGGVRSDIVPAYSVHRSVVVASPHPTQCAHWATFPQRGKAIPAVIWAGLEPAPTGMDRRGRRADEDIRPYGHKPTFA